MDMDFLAIDFETACKNLNSACSIGLVAVKDLCIVDSAYSLLRPPELYFDSMNVRVHGITPDMVESAPTLDEFWPEISWMFSEHCPVVAHNAHFDMSTLRLSSSVAIPNFPYVNSIQIASPLVAGSCSLENCCETLHIDLPNHHNALDDARACAEIAICGIESAGCLSMWEYLALSPHISIRRLMDLFPQQTMVRKADKPKIPQYISPSEIYAPTDVNFDVTHPFYGKSIVFTGELTIDRRVAMQMVANVGGILKSSVSRKTDYLIVGLQDKSLVGDDGLSVKQEKAIEINQSGKGQITVLNETEFLALLHRKEEALPHG